MKKAISNIKTQVLVIGAGPVGLLAAYSLHQYGVSVRIIDKKKAQDIDRMDAKAITIGPYTLEFLNSLGLFEEFSKEGVRCRGFVRVKNGLACSKSGFGTIDGMITDFPYLLHLPQWKVEELLTNALSKKGISVEYGSSFHSVDITNQVPLTTIIKEDQEELINSEYVLAADGASSPVRKALGLGISVGVEPLLSFHHLDLELTGFLESKSSRYLYTLKNKCVAIMPISAQFQRMVIIQRNEDVTHELTADDFQATLKELGYGNAKIKTILSLKKYQPVSSLCNTYINGPVFLLGDASHPVSPITGQGINTGFQDVANLSWKLVMVLMNKATSKILESYHDERHDAGQQLIARAGRLTNFIRALLSRGFKGFFARRFFSSDGFLTNYLTEQSQLSINYTQSIILQSTADAKLAQLSSLLPGIRFPNIHVCTSSGRQSLYSQTSYDRYLLVLFSADQGLEVIDKLIKLKHFALERHPQIVRTVILIHGTLSPSDFHNSLGYPNDVCIDSDGVHQRFKISKPCYILIRPDHYIACIGTLEDEGLITQLIN